MFKVIAKFFNFRHYHCHNPNITDCQQILNEMHKQNSKFVNQAMDKSDPFLMCTDLDSFSHYRQTMECYDKLFAMINPKNKSHLCSDEMLNKNRMNVITSFIGYSRTTWNSANCDDCYGGIVSTVQNFSQYTKEFLESHFLFNQCIQNITIDPKVNNSVVCTSCETRYEKLNGLFEQIKLSTENKICFDLEDKVRWIIDNPYLK